MCHHKMLSNTALGEKDKGLMRAYFLFFFAMIMMNVEKTLDGDVIKWEEKLNESNFLCPCSGREALLAF